jgi:hypothetical protein
LGYCPIFHQDIARRQDQPGDGMHGGVFEQERLRLRCETAGQED